MCEHRSAHSPQCEYECPDYCSAWKPVLDEAPGNLPYIQSRRRCVSTSPFLAAMRSIKVVCVGDARCGKVLSISPLCFRFEPKRFKVWPLDRCFGKAYI